MAGLSPNPCQDYLVPFEEACLNTFKQNAALTKADPATLLLSGKPGRPALALSNTQQLILGTDAVEPKLTNITLTDIALSGFGVCDSGTMKITLQGGSVLNAAYSFTDNGLTENGILALTLPGMPLVIDLTLHTDFFDLENPAITFSYLSSNTSDLFANIELSQALAANLDTGSGASSSLISALAASTSQNVFKTQLSAFLEEALHAELERIAFLGSYDADTQTLNTTTIMPFGLGTAIASEEGLIMPSEPQIDLTSIPDDGID
jgi:hypothetical protein